MVFYIWNKILSLTHKKDGQWSNVLFPKKQGSLLFKFVGLLIIIFLWGILWGFLESSTLRMNILGGLINRLLSGTFIVLWLITTYFSVRGYLGLFKRNKSWIANNLVYMINSLKLYDEEYFETTKNDKVVREKRIVRVIRIQYRETSKHIVVRILRDGDRFTNEATKLGENLESALGLELDSTNKTVDYAEYVFLKNKDKRIDLNSTVTSMNGSDEIKITENISYELHKVPHSLIVGGTGSGKSFFILGKIVSYLNLSPQADLRIIDPKKADLSLLRFVTGFENKVVTEANQICRILRETVELMEQRYTDYFNDISAFGKTYRDFGLPPIIIVFDEFSAFIHSVDKKVAREALDYVFVLVMKGRAAGVTIEILMQRPSADDLPTNIRAQMGFKAGLGTMDSIGYNMVFDTNNVEYKTVTEKGGGYVQIDGKHTAPVYFETPYIDKDFDFIAEIERLMSKQKETSANTVH